MTRTTAREVAEHLGLQLIGADAPLTAPSSLDAPFAGALVFAKRLDAATLKSLAETPGVVVIVPESDAGRLTVSHIPAPRPRLAFAKAVQRFFARPAALVDNTTARVHPTARIGDRVRIGPGVVIGPEVSIGDDTILHANVVIEAGTIIGARSEVKSGTVIGQSGFGFDFEPDGTPVRLPHVGRVVIGDDVELGALNTVVRATLGTTSVGNHVKTDDHVHIAHNCSIGRAAILTACAELSGSVTLEEQVWLGPNCSILNRVRIGRRAMVGIGAVVTKDVADNALVVGNPARFLRERRPDE
ncbi:MAG: transferase [Deltaproteobacteria bacterium]|nr:transferase [Deltaproteobacteria bacterium]